MPIELTPSPTSPLVSIYGSYNALAAEIGASNIAILSDPENEQNPSDIANYQQYAANYADGVITTELNNNGYVIPTVQNLPMLMIIWAKLAAFQLYQLRGMDSNKENYFTDKRDWAMTELRALTFGNRGGFATTVHQGPRSVHRRGYYSDQGQDCSI